MEQVDWGALVARYDLKGDGKIDSFEFSALLGDLLHLRDEVKYSYQECISKVKYFKSLPCWSSEGLSAEELKNAAIGGMFDAEHISPDLLRYLAAAAEEAAPMGPPLMTRKPSSLKDALQDRDDRKLVALALQRGNSKSTTISMPEQNVNGCAPSQSKLSMKLCEVCMDHVKDSEMWRWDSSHKRCSCDTAVCVSCLRDCARFQIKEGERPRCLKCSVPLEQWLLAGFFSAECPLCQMDIRSGDARAFVPQGCPLDHTFCLGCLQIKAKTALSSTPPAMPRCPRYSECRFEYDELTLMEIFRDDSDVDAILFQWHDLKKVAVDLSWRGNKRCPSSCPGTLRATLDEYKRAVVGKAVDIACDACDNHFCFTCEKPYHYQLSCFDASEITRRWGEFLRLAVVSEEGNNTGLVASSALQQLDNEMASAAFFRERIGAGQIKRCPRCRKNIEKLGGCDVMVCGQNADGGNNQSGCGLRFKWSDVPLMAVRDFGDINVMKENPLKINITDPHVDLATLSPSAPPKIVVCSNCKKNVQGTLFECINCANQTGVCFTCVKSLMSFERHKGHVFRITDPPQRPRASMEIALGSISPEGHICVCIDSPVEEKERRGAAVTTSRAQYTLCQVGVYPDGRVVFEDCDGLGVGALHLNTILYQIPSEDITENLNVLLNNNVIDTEAQQLKEYSYSGIETISGEVFWKDSVVPYHPSELTRLDGCTVRISSATHKDEVLFAVELCKNTSRYGFGSRHVVMLREEGLNFYSSIFSSNDRWVIEAKGRNTFHLNNQSSVSLSAGRTMTDTNKRDVSAMIKSNINAEQFLFTLETIPTEESSQYYRLYNTGPTGEPSYLCVSECDDDPSRRGVKLHVGAMTAEIFAQSLFHIEVLSEAIQRSRAIPTISIVGTVPRPPAVDVGFICGISRGQEARLNLNCLWAHGAPSRELRRRGQSSVVDSALGYSIVGGTVHLFGTISVIAGKTKLLKLPIALHPSNSYASRYYFPVCAEFREGGRYGIAVVSIGEDGVISYCGSVGENYSNFSKLYLDTVHYPGACGNAEHSAETKDAQISVSKIAEIADESPSKITFSAPSDVPPVAPSVAFSFGTGFSSGFFNTKVVGSTTPPSDAVDELMIITTDSKEMEENEKAESSSQKTKMSSPESHRVNIALDWGDNVAESFAGSSGCYVQGLLCYFYGEICTGSKLWNQGDLIAVLPENVRPLHPIKVFALVDAAPEWPVD